MGVWWGSGGSLVGVWWGSGWSLVGVWMESNGGLRGVWWGSLTWFDDITVVCKQAAVWWSSRSEQKLLRLVILSQVGLQAASLILSRPIRALLSCLSNRRRDEGDICGMRHIHVHLFIFTNLHSHQHHQNYRYLFIHIDYPYRLYI